MYHLSQAMLNRLTDSHLKLLAAQGAIENPEHFDKTSLSQALYNAQERSNPSLSWENLHDWLLAREDEPRSSRKPSDVPDVRIAPPPDCFPPAARSLCLSHVPQESQAPDVTERDTTSPDPVGDEALRAAKSALEEAFAPKSDRDEIPQLAREHGLDETVTRRAVELKRSGKGITAIAAELNITRASNTNSLSFCDTWPLLYPRPMRPRLNHLR